MVSILVFSASYKSSHFNDPQLESIVLIRFSVRILSSEFAMNNSLDENSFVRLIGNPMQAISWLRDDVLSDLTDTM